MTAQSAEEAGESLVEIRNHVSHINKMSIQSATAAEEQGTVVNGKHCNIEGIRTISEQTMTAAQQASEASGSLSQSPLACRRC